MEKIYYVDKWVDEYISDAPIIFNPPRKAIVWDNPGAIPDEEDVLSYDPRRRDGFHVVTAGVSWKHCAFLDDIAVGGDSSVDAGLDTPACDKGSAYYEGIIVPSLGTGNVPGLPKRMLVWKEGEHIASVRMVAAIAVDSEGTAVAVARPIQGSGLSLWAHFAEIPEKAPGRRATNIELALWLAQGYGQLDTNPTTKTVGNIMTHYPYTKTHDNDPVPDSYMVRRWDDDGWHAPTADYLLLEDK